MQITIEKYVVDTKQFCNACIIRQDKTTYTNLQMIVHRPLKIKEVKKCLLKKIEMKPYTKYSFQILKIDVQDVHTY